MRVRLSQDEGVYLLFQLDMWIEGYKDIDDDLPKSVVLQLLADREQAERIRLKIWLKLRG